MRELDEAVVDEEMQMMELVLPQKQDRTQMNDSKEEILEA